MVGLERLVNRWIDNGVNDMPDDETPPPPSPGIATISPPDTIPRGESDADRDARIFGEAAVRTNQLRRTIEAEAERNRLLNLDLEETRQLLSSERKKSGFLELENAELRNNLQVSEADRLAFVETQQKSWRP